MSLPFFAFSLPVWAGEFTITDPETILYQGDILVGDDLVFKGILQGGSLRRLTITSQGGDLYTAMQIGRAIKRAGLDTHVESHCYSACTVAFIMGETRTMNEDAEIGFHRVQNAQTGETVAVESALYNRLTLYSFGAGVDPVRFVGWMFSASPDGLYIPTNSELCAARILNSCE